MHHVNKQHDMSYSMVVDKQPIQSKPFQKIEPRHIYTWVKDEAVTQCYECKQPFSIVVGRHHCRLCGRIFCHTCSSTFVHIPSYLKSIFPIPKGKEDNIITTFVKDSFSILNPFNIIGGSNEKSKTPNKNSSNKSRSSKILRRSQDISYGGKTIFISSTPINIQQSYEPTVNCNINHIYNNQTQINLQNNYADIEPEDIIENKINDKDKTPGSSPNSAQLFGQYLDTLLDNNEDDTLDPSDSEEMDTSHLKKVRTCTPCHEKLKRLCDLEKQIRVFNLMDLDILFLKKIGLVCKSWNQLSIYYLSRFREIQYYLYDHKYLELDKKLLWINRDYLYGHSVWLLQLIRSIDYRSYNDRSYKLPIIEKIIEKWGKKQKSISCWQLMCTRHCCENLRPEDCICLLDENIKSDSIRKFAIHHMSVASVAELRCYLPTLVHYIRYESMDRSFIVNYLIGRSNEKNGLEIANDLFWLLKVNSETKNIVYKSLYEFHLDNFKRSISPTVLNNILKGEHLMNIINTISVENKPVTAIQRSLVHHINETNISKFACPTKPNLKYTSLVYEKVDKFKSATNPLLLPFTYEITDLANKTNNKKENNTIYSNNTKNSIQNPQKNIGNGVYNYQILYKPEDVRKDMVIMNIIKLMDIVLKEEGLDLHIITYDVKSISADRGIIEMVPDCVTMYTIREKMRFSILNYIIEKNPNENIDTIRRRFMQSCSAYCVITYLLGIGDRHLDNIMITSDGYMFHVDYGYVLGFDPKPMTMPQMRITDDMIDVLGGASSACYHEFKELCNKIYNILRGHVSIFLNLLTLLVEMDPLIDNNTPFTKKILKKEIMDRFIPGETYQEANLQLISHIENSSTYGQYVNDFFHYHAKENTIQKTLNTTVEGTKNILSNLYGFFKK